MGIPLEDWIKFVQAHPLKMKFEGLEDSDRNECWQKDVRVAATYSRQYMDEYISNEVDSYAEMATTDFSDQYAYYLRRKYGHEWEGKKNINHCADSTVIKAFGSDDRAREWAYDYVDPQFCWDCIKEDDEEAMLKEHPPVQVWSHACGCGIDVDEVFFICPSCHGEPTTESDSKGAFYCGSCGAESSFGAGEDMVDFFIAMGMGTEPDTENLIFPFNKQKRDEWVAKIQERLKANDAKE